MNLKLIMKTDPINGHKTDLIVDEAIRSNIEEGDNDDPLSYYLGLPVAKLETPQLPEIVNIRNLSNQMSLLAYIAKKNELRKWDIRRFRSALILS